jgi:hypothetical protein
MANDTIGIDEPSAIDKLLDTESLVVGANTVHRERTQIAGDAAAAIAKVTNADPAGGDYALAVRTIPGATATPVSAASLPLPTGAATGAKQDTGNASLASIDGKVATETTLALIKAKTDNLDVALSTRTKPTDVQAVSATSLPLPTGAAQDATLTGGTAKGIVRGGAKGATAAADVTSTAEGADHQAIDVQLYHGAVAKDPTAIRALTTADAVNVGQWFGSAVPTVGQKVMASSVPVVMASDQGVIPVSDNAGSLTVDAPVATPVFARLSDGAAALIAQKTMALSLPVVVASDQSVLSVIGDVDHDAVNTLKNFQGAGHASPSDVPPALVSAAGDRARIWVDRAGAQIMRRRKLRESYTAVCRLAETTARLDFTFTHVANTNKQLVTFHHPATAVKEIRIQKVVIFATLLGTAAGFWCVELRAITGTPATGNPAITPKAHRLDAAATEAVCLVLPTTGGTDATPNSPYGSFTVDHGIEATTPPVAHPLVSGLTAGFPFTLYDASAEDDEMHPIILRVGTLEGVAINSRDTAAMVLRAWAIIKYTEEIP